MDRKANKGKANDAQNNEEENMQTQEITQASEEQAAPAPVNSIMEANVAKMEEENTEYDLDHLDEDEREEWALLVKRESRLKTELGDAPERIAKGNDYINGLRLELETWQKTIKDLQEGSRQTQIKLRDVQDRMHELRTPITLRSLKGAGRRAASGAVVAGTGGVRLIDGKPNERVVSAALDVLGKVPDPSNFGYADIMAAKACEQPTASITVHRFKEGGIIVPVVDTEGKPLKGRYRVSDEYASLV